MKFSIRDLFLVTVIVAVVLGWGLDHWRQAKKAKALSEAARQAESQFTMLKDMVEVEGIQVWSEKKENGEVQMSVEFPAPAALPNSSAPAPTPPKK